MIFSNILGPQAPVWQMMLVNFVGFLLILMGAPIVGGLLSGVDRVLTARLQGRKGPPLLQPFYDFFKLLGKESKLSSKMQVVWMGGYLFLTAFSLMFLFMGQDLLVVVFLMGFAAVSLVLAGFSVKSPYANMGAQRELLQIFACEPVLLLFAICVFLHNGSFMIGRIFESPAPMLFELWPVFLALLIVWTVKLRKSPFDFSTSHHAHQEIVKGITTEFSGEYYAIFILAEWYETVVLLCFIAMFWAHPIWIGIVIALLAFLLEIIIDNITARMTVKWMISYTWVITLILCAANIYYLYFK